MEISTFLIEETFASKDEDSMKKSIQDKFDQYLKNKIYQDSYGK